MPMLLKPGTVCVIFCKPSTPVTLNVLVTFPIIFGSSPTVFAKLVSPSAPPNPVAAVKIVSISCVSPLNIPLTFLTPTLLIIFCKPGTVSASLVKLDPNFPCGAIMPLGKLNSLPKLPIALATVFPTPPGNAPLLKLLSAKLRDAVFPPPVVLRSCVEPPVKTPVSGKGS